MIGRDARWLGDVKGPYSIRWKLRCFGAVLGSATFHVHYVDRRGAKHHQAAGDYKTSFLAMLSAMPNAAWRATAPCRPVEVLKARIEMGTLPRRGQARQTWRACPTGSPWDFHGQAPPLPTARWRVGSRHGR